MGTIHTRLLATSSLLAPYAAPLGGSLGREIAEPSDETRFPFQRDRDRIIHTQAFRRLQGKTQVFVAGEGSDHVRTRLTHTMEVAQIARDIARTLALNEDLAECIALAHDLGHPPFGHRGEWELHAWAREQGSAFEHNEQSVRIVTVLERHSPLAKGLNLNLEVLEGMRKHREVWVETPFPRSQTLEAQTVDKADEIAYMGHDSDDGLRAELFTLEDITQTALARKAQEQAHERGTSLRGALIHLLVTDLYRETERLLSEKKVRLLEDVYASDSPLLDFSPAMHMQVRELRAFLMERMYDHPRVKEASEEGQHIIRLLCSHFLTVPSARVEALQFLASSTLVEAVRDYVAGMTDTFAKSQATELSLL